MDLTSGYRTLTHDNDEDSAVWFIHMHAYVYCFVDCCATSRITSYSTSHTENTIRGVGRSETIAALAWPIRGRGPLVAFWCTPSLDLDRPIIIMRFMRLSSENIRRIEDVSNNITTHDRAE